MLDLNVLVPPVSDLTLADVEKINDRGEMFGNAALPNGDARAFLLIPCDDDHPGVEGCDYGMVDAATAAAQSAARPYVSSSTQRVPKSRSKNRLFGLGH